MFNDKISNYLIVGLILKIEITSHIRSFMLYINLLIGRKMTMRKFFILLISGILLSTTGCSSNLKNKSQYPVSSTEFVLNTVSTVTIYSDNKENDPNEVINDSFKLCRQYENMLSRTIEGSEIDRINKSNGETIEVSSEVSDLLNTSLKYSQLTNGNFDVTIEPVSSLWDFQSESAVPPDKELIDKNINFVDYTQVDVNGNTVTLNNPNTAIDLGAIAKGYIADRMKEFLIEKGVTSAIINLGGNILAIGERDENKPFNIGIQSPTEEQNQVIGSVEINNKSVVTSGVYERYFEYKGKRYHHILNPNTGYPVENELLSVTIISDKSVDGDALSTGCFVLGLEKGMELINSLENVEAIFITKDNKLKVSDGIGKNVVFKELKNERI